MRVMLVSPPFVENFMRNARWDVIGQAGGQWYPIYLAYCTGLLEKYEHTVKLLDAQVDKLTHVETYAEVEKFNPDLIVVQYSNKAFENDFRFGLNVKTLTNKQVVFVGTSANTTAQQVVSRSYGKILAVVGEYDYTILDLADKKPLEDINGLVWYNEQVNVNDPRQAVTSEQLNHFPFVSSIYKKHLNIKNYNQADQFYPYIDMFTGRGCSWGKCTFCLYPNTINKGSGYRTRTIDNVIEELEYIKSEMPEIKEVFFQDDTLPADRIIELSSAILGNNLKLTWSCYARATADMNINVLKLMKRAGCRTMHVGYESSNQELLKNMCKGISVKTAEQFTKDANKVGLLIVADFLVGLPGETVETIKETVRWAKKLPVQRYTFSLPKPYPDTPFYDYLKANNYLKDGHPNYPELSSEQIYCMNKWAYRKVYLSYEYLLKVMFRPSEWDRIAKSAIHALPYFFNKEPQSHKELEW